MRNNGRIIDAWMQHMTPSFIGNPMFESLQALFARKIWRS